MFFPAFFFLLLGCIVAWLTILGLRLTGFGRQTDNDPQHHHTHSGVVPRIGGLGMILGFAAVYLFCFFLFDPEDNMSLMHYAVFVGGAAAFLLGFIDDFRPLGAKLKLLAQVIIAIFAHECGLSIEKISVPFVAGGQIALGLLSLPLTVFWFVAMMNLINLIDGLDGLAGGIGLMLMVLLAYLGFQEGIAFSTILAIGMLGAILGFLFHNFPPAKVYMGDSGAYLIGYVIAALSLLNSVKGSVAAALIAPVLALALPIADVAFALLRRGFKGLPLFRPDRSHIHHRLIRTGLSHRNTVLLLYSVSLVALVGGLLVFTAQGRYLPIFLGFTFVLILLGLRGQFFSIQEVRDRLLDSINVRQDARNALYLRDWFVLEAERADAAAHLWADFQFILKKMGFCRAELEIQGEERKFFVPNTPHNDPEMLHAYTYPVRTAAGGQLKLYANKDSFSERQFQIIADIAVEAWARAAARWRELNGCEMTFEALAKDPDTYRRQKARNLYRPTY